MSSAQIDASPAETAREDDLIQPAAPTINRGATQSPSVRQTARSQNITLWKSGKISQLSSGEKKRYYKRKSAIRAYLTTEDSLEEISQHYHLSTEIIEKLAKQCLMLHEDGTPWGFRALLPGVKVIDHTPLPSVPTTPFEEISASENEASTETLSPDETKTLCNHTGTIPSEPAPTAAEMDMDDTAEREAVHLSHRASDFTPQDARPEQPEQPEQPPEDDTLHVADAREVPAIIEDQALPVPGAALPETDKTSLSNDSEMLHRDSSDERNVVAPLAGAIIDEPLAGAIIDEPLAGAIIDEPLAGAIIDEPLAGAIIDEPLAGAMVDEPLAGAITDEPVAGTIERAMVDVAPVEEDTTTVDVAPAWEEEAIAEAIIQVEVDASPGQTWESTIVDPPAKIVRDMTVRSLVVREELLPAVIARINKRPTANTSRQVLLARRTIRRDWVRKKMRAKHKRAHIFVGAAVVAVMFFALLVPVAAGLAAYSAYSSIRGVTLDGVSHLMAVKALLPVSKSDPTAALNTPKLQMARVQLAQAQGDFLQLQQLVNQPGIQTTLQQYAPQFVGKLGMAQHLVRVGIDVTQMGNELIGVALLGANVLHGSPLASGSTKPLITVADVSNVEAAMTHTLYYINDIRTQMSQVSLNDLPISASQKNELTSVLSLLPKVQSYVQQGQGLVGLVSWLLGVGQTRRFLVQTMDRAELRPGGGFTGQYGILQIQNGRMAPFSLQDVTELDYASNGAELGRQAPPQYRSWMNFGNWGLRDSNLSGDFPTTAQLAMQVYQDEGGGPVDGDIAFTPVVIEHILDIIGPIKVPQYNETITAQNLEDRLHYYQQDTNAIILQQQKTGTHNAATRKAFTTLLGKLLLDKLRHLPVPTLMKIVQNATKDIQSRDLEIYFTDPQAEAWLVAHNYSGAMSTFSKQDGFMVVQANISISKASQYVHTTYQDNISLDAQGGAMHTLTITLDYQQTGPVYGQNTYADYIRVYAPANAVFQGGDGFDTGHSLCNGSQVPGSGGTGGKSPVPVLSHSSLSSCGQFATYFPGNERYCPDGNYNLSGPNSFVPGKGFMPWPVDALGPPTELTSDLPGRAMWGGLTVTPMNCTSTITLSWYVPNIVKHVTGQPIYSVLVQKQGGYVPTVQISIDTSQLNGVKPYNFQGNLPADRTFALQVVKPKHS